MSNETTDFWGIKRLYYMVSVLKTMKPKTGVPNVTLPFDFDVFYVTASAFPDEKDLLEIAALRAGDNPDVESFKVMSISMINVLAFNTDGNMYILKEYETEK